MTVLGKISGDFLDIGGGYPADGLCPRGVLVLELDVPPAHEAVRIAVLEAFLVDFLALLEQVDLLVVVARLVQVPRSVLEAPDKLPAPLAGHQDLVCNRHGEGAVGAGNDGDPQVGLCRRRRETRVDDDDVRVVHHLPPAIGGVGLLAVRGDGVGGPQQQVLAVRKVVVAIREQPVDRPRRELLLLRADGAVAKVVRRAHEGGQEMGQNIARLGCAPLHEDDLVRLVVVVELEPLGGDSIERLVPGDGNETRVDATPFLGVRALHRDLDAVGVVELVDGERGLGAHLPVRRRAVGVALHADDAAVLRPHLDRAKARATLTARRSPLAREVLLVRLVGSGKGHEGS